MAYVALPPNMMPQIAPAQAPAPTPSE
jgi:hypothetical protein